MLGLKSSQTPHHLGLFREEEQQGAYSEGHTVHNLLRVALQNHSGGKSQKNTHSHSQSHAHPSQNVQIGKVKQNRSHTSFFNCVLCHVASFLYPIQKDLTFFSCPLPCHHLPSINNFIHSQEQSLHILQQSPPFHIFSMCKNE